MSALPYLASWFWALFVSFLADYVISNGKLSRAKTRKGLSAIALLTPAIGVLIITTIGNVIHCLVWIRH